jgi:hypothetical protein
METPNATATTGSGKTAEQVEFEAGATLKREGKQLPDLASESARKGYDSVVLESDTTVEKPGAAKETGGKTISTHRVAPKAETDRPVPEVSPTDAEDLNPNEKVSITIDQPGKRYFIEGRGASVDVNFEADVTPESLIAVAIDHLQGGEGEAGTKGDFARNAVNDLKKALDWLHQGTRDRFKRLGVTEPSGANPVTPADGAKPLGLA